MKIILNEKWNGTLLKEDRFVFNFFLLLKRVRKGPLASRLSNIGLLKMKERGAAAAREHGTH